MFISGKSIRSIASGALVFAVLSYHADNMGPYLWMGVGYFVFMFTISVMQDNYRLSKHQDYKSLKISPKFSKPEIILKLNEVFSVTFSDGMLLIKELNITIEFLENNAILITGSQKNVDKMRDIL